MTSHAVMDELKLPRLGQVGYVVTDLAKTMAYYRDTFRIRPWLLLDERPEPCFEGEKEVHPLLKMALAYSGPVQLELIQVAEGESFHLRHLEQSKGGLHHLGFMVGDIDRRLDRCRRMGIGILQRGTIRDIGFTVDYAYLDTFDRAGVILELIQWRLGRMPVPVNRFVFNLLALVGEKSFLKGKVVT